MTGDVVWGGICALGLLDLILILPAIYTARQVQTVGRLVGAALLIAGVTLSSAQRFTQHASLTWGLGPLTVGLILFAVFLPMRRKGRS